MTRMNEDESPSSARHAREEERVWNSVQNRIREQEEEDRRIIRRNEDREIRERYRDEW